MPQSVFWVISICGLRLACQNLHACIINLAEIRKLYPCLHKEPSLWNYYFQNFYFLLFCFVLFYLKLKTVFGTTCISSWNDFALNTMLSWYRESPFSSYWFLSSLAFSWTAQKVLTKRTMPTTHRSVTWKSWIDILGHSELISAPSNCQTEERPWDQYKAHTSLSSKWRGKIPTA